MKREMEFMKNQTEFEEIMDQYPQIPVEVMRPWQRGCGHESLRGRFWGAVMTQAMTPEQFREMARNMIRTGKATIQDGYFKLM